MVALVLVEPLQDALNVDDAEVEAVIVGEADLEAVIVTDAVFVADTLKVPVKDGVDDGDGVTDGVGVGEKLNSHMYGSELALETSFNPEPYSWQAFCRLPSEYGVYWLPSLGWLVSHSLQASVEHTILEDEVPSTQDQPLYTVLCDEAWLQPMYGTELPYAESTVANMPPDLASVLNVIK